MVEIRDEECLGRGVGGSREFSGVYRIRRCIIQKFLGLFKRLGSLEKVGYSSNYKDRRVIEEVEVEVFLLFNQKVWK